MKNLSYEDSLERLDEVLEKLEDGNLPLEKHLELFEESVLLHRHCMEILNKTEKTVKLIVKDNEIIEEDFDMEV